MSAGIVAVDLTAHRVDLEQEAEGYITRYRMVPTVGGEVLVSFWSDQRGNTHNVWPVRRATVLFNSLKLAGFKCKSTPINDRVEP